MFYILILPAVFILLLVGTTLIVDAILGPIKIDTRQSVHRK
jgi:hypothetical protein